MDKAVTIKDVAQKAGVSTATVSYVLNDSRPVREETRRRVLRAAKELNYRPSVIARGLQARESRMLGYSWLPSQPDQFEPILERFLHTTAEAAEERGYHMLTFPCPGPYDEIQVYRNMVRSGRVDGFILSNTNLNDHRIRYLMDADFPFVAFGRSNPNWDFPWVDVDGTDGVRQGVDHLVSLGHQRIACLAWPQDSLTGQYRLQGYLDGMDSAGLPVNSRWIIRTENFYQDAYQNTQTWLALPAAERPSAIVALTDLMAIGVMNAAADAGLQVGRDLAVLGFDNAPMTNFLRPPLTSLRQPITEIGQMVVDMLIDLVHEQRPEPYQKLLKPQLVVRDSTALSARR